MKKPTQQKLDRAQGRKDARHFLRVTGDDIGEVRREVTRTEHLGVVVTRPYWAGYLAALRRAVAV